MWGALIFLLAFLVIDTTTREAIIAAIEEAQLRMAVEAPWPYFLLVIVVGSAIVSALIMKFWPRTENRFRRVQVMHRYQGQAAPDLVDMRRTAPFGVHRVLELPWLLLPVRVRIACGKLLREGSGIIALKRLPRPSR